MSDTPTPRTDKATRMAFANEHMVPTEFAQEIERELAEANADYMALARRPDGHDATECLLNLNQMKSDLAETRAENKKLIADMILHERMASCFQDERDTLAEALQELYDKHTLQGAAYELIERALAVVKGGEA